MKTVSEKFIQTNSPDGGFLQSEYWRKFQEAVGRKTYNISGEGFSANIIGHILPIVGKYFYIPRGPVINEQQSANSSQCVEKIVNLARENKAGWIRFDPTDEKDSVAIKNSTEYKTVKAPHDMQPREILVMEITKPEEEILAEMKPKTRYNIKLAGRNPKLTIRASSDKKDIDEFLRLVHITACRNKIACHPESYYRKMLEIIPGDILKLYVAEYENKIIAANLVIFYGQTATYLHGASDDEYRNVMAPHLLQWKQIQDAKKFGCTKYDFGGVKINLLSGKSWAGVTRFKTSFSPNTSPIEFPGSYDIIIDKKKYFLYKILSVAMPVIRRFKE